MVVLLEGGIRETALGEALEPRQLSTLVARATRITCTGLGALVTATGRLAVSAAFTTTNALSCLESSYFFGDLMRSPKK